MEETKAQETAAEVTTEQKPLEIQIDAQTAFQLKLQEFDKNIAIAEFQVSDVKKQKAEFVYSRNIQMITEQYKQQQMQKQVEEETRRKLAEADIKSK